MPEGMGKKKGMLVLDPAMLAPWRTMNATERYFNLLEAWLRHGRAEMLGERSGWMTSMLGACKKSGSELPFAVQPASLRKAHLAYGRISFCCLALCELFGLLDVSRDGPAGKGTWPILDVHSTEFGAALVETLIGDPLGHHSFGPPRRRTGFWGLATTVPGVFPEWRKNLAFPEPEYRDGVFVFKAKLGPVWRRIAIPADCEFEDRPRSMERMGRMKFGLTSKNPWRASRPGSKVTHEYCDPVDNCGSGGENPCVYSQTLLDNDRFQVCLSQKGARKCFTSILSRSSAS